MNPASRLRFGPLPPLSVPIVTEGQPVAALATTMDKPRLIAVTADEAARLNPGRAWEPPVWLIGRAWYGESTAIERWRGQQGTGTAL